ncbi:MAG: HPP family protein [Candidatus Scalindua sp.]
MFIKDVMSVDVIAIGENVNLIQLIAKFREHSFHTLPVIDDKKKILGVITPEDIMKVFLPHNPALDKLLRSTHLCNLDEEDILETELPKDIGTSVKVSDIMNTDVIAIEESKTISDARGLMNLHNIERMPVTKDDVLVGFITVFDIIIALFRERNIIL